MTIKSQQYGLNHQLFPHFILPVIDTECLEEVEPTGYSVMGWRGIAVVFVWKIALFNGLDDSFDFLGEAVGHNHKPLQLCV